MGTRLNPYRNADEISGLQPLRQELDPNSLLRVPLNVGRERRLS